MMISQARWWGVSYTKNSLVTGELSVVNEVKGELPRSITQIILMVVWYTL